jgi:hypothetical protein
VAGRGAAVVVEGAHPHALLAQEVEVHVRDGHPRLGREAFGLGQEQAVLEDLRLPVPGDFGGGLAGAGGGVDVGREAAADCDWQSSRRVSALPMVIGLPEMFSSTVAPASAAREEGGTGIQKSSQISVWTTRPGTSSASNSRSEPKGATWPAKRASPGGAPSPGAACRRS